MSSTKPYKFSYGEQINQYTSYNYSAKLLANTVASITVPYLSNINEGIIAIMTCRAENDSFVSVACNETPSVPSSSTFSQMPGEMFNEQNIIRKRVSPGDILNFISNTNDTYVGVSFYSGNSF